MEHRLGKALRGVVLAAGLAGLSGCTADAPSKAAQEASGSSLRIEVRFSETLSEAPQDGRLLLMLSTKAEGEPRFHVNNNADTQLIFGQNVEGWGPETAVAFDGDEASFPLPSLAAVPPGTYRVQALLNRYKDFTLSNGKTVSLPPDQGEGQQWNRKPGNFLSAPFEVTLGPGAEQISVVLDQKIPPLTPPEDTAFVKHVRLRSERLSEFWGEDVYLGANVLLPKDFAKHPEARFPLMVFHGHFPRTIGDFTRM